MLQRKRAGTRHSAFKKKTIKTRKITRRKQIGGRRRVIQPQNGENDPRNVNNNGDNSNGNNNNGNNNNGNSASYGANVGTPNQNINNNVSNAANPYEQGYVNITPNTSNNGQQ
jgi:hypothetical protein